jgi:hypothetical protein
MQVSLICMYDVLYNDIFLTQNSFPMKQWHLEHVEKTIKKFITGLSETASIWEKRQHKRYGTIANCCKQVDYDLKHGVTIDEVIQVLHKVKNDETFASVMQSENAILRFNEIEKYVLSLKNPRTE